VEKHFCIVGKGFEINLFQAYFWLPPPPPGHSLHQSVETWLKLEVCFIALKTCLKQHSSTFYSLKNQNKICEHMLNGCTLALSHHLGSNAINVHTHRLPFTAQILEVIGLGAKAYVHATAQRIFRKILS
jgi:hypothetical protein